jgi:hypothetical protein
VKEQPRVARGFVSVDSGIGHAPLKPAKQELLAYSWRAKKSVGLLRDQKEMARLKIGRSWAVDPLAGRVRRQGLSVACHHFRPRKQTDMSWGFGIATLI